MSGHLKSFPKTAMFRRVLLGIALFLTLALLAMDRYAAAVHRPRENSTRVAIYTTRSCPYCERLRRSLQASRVPHAEFDVERSLQGQLGMWALGGRGVPVAVIGSQVVYGYQVAEIAEALRALGYTFLPAQ
jgi:glutaredoxin